MNSIISTDIQRAITLLTNNEVVAIPTETVYGLAGNIFSAAAIEKIYRLKQRPKNNPLIVHTHSIEEIKKYVTHIPHEVNLLMQAFCPGAITFLLPKNDKIPDYITNKKKLVAIRIPQHATTLSLLQQLPFPLAAPSANRSNYISPTNAKDVLDTMQQALPPMVLDGGKCSIGVESTIVEWKNNKLVIHRQGGITIEKIQKILGNATPIVIAKKNPEHTITPGKSLQHYSPKTRLLVGDIEILIKKNLQEKIGVVSFGKTFKSKFLNSVKFEYVLTTNGNLDKVAQKLYATLLKLDSCGLSLIIIELAEPIGIGLAINDRILKASINKPI